MKDNEVIKTYTVEPGNFDTIIELSKELENPMTREELTRIYWQQKSLNRAPAVWARMPKLLGRE